jgi:alkylation response protein AidB-like acyl-CoA dehydrogenase
MDIRFDKSQKLLQDSFRKFLQKEFASEQVRQIWETEKGYSPEKWKKMADLGWLGLRIPGEHGGDGLSFTDLCILFEEMGRMAMPGPFLSTMMVAETVMDAGSPEQKKNYLTRIARGDLRATLAIWEPDSHFDASGINLTAAREGDHFVLDGTKLFVCDVNASEMMVVAARTRRGVAAEEGITLFIMEGNLAGVVTTSQKTMDEGRRQGEAGFTRVSIPVSNVLGEVDMGWKVLEKTLNKGAVALSAECVGGGQKVLEMVVDYAKKRVQFDKPIGSFQAIKHKCAQMMLEVEGARSIAYYASWMADQEGRDTDVSASASKAYCSDMFRKATEEAIQMFGAIGLTWEHDMHMFYKRAKMNEYTFGDPSFHRERLANLLEY